MLLLGCGVLAAFATPTALMLALLLLPSLLAACADGRAGKPSLPAVVLFGLAASCRPLDTLWRIGSLDVAVTLATDLPTLALAWSAQAGGWLLTQILPLAVGIGLKARADAATALVERRRAELLDEWAPEPPSSS